MTQEFVQASVIRRMLFMLKVDDILYKKGHANARLFNFRKASFIEMALMNKHYSRISIAH